MKNLLYFCLLVVFCDNVTQAQTYANAPGPENVLVVYNSDSDTSLLVANYYRNKRNIPQLNIVQLSLSDTTITVDGIAHNIVIAEGGNIIRDLEGHNGGAWFVTEHA